MIKEEKNKKLLNKSNSFIYYAVIPFNILVKRDF